MHLKRVGLLKTLPVSARFSGIVLTPAATQMISLEDAELIAKNGVCVIDCSWAFFETVKVKSNKKHERILPNLLAANTINYGKEFKLNCAEAFAAACYLTGYEEQARFIMSKFKYGPAFFAINEYRFAQYRGMKTSAEMIAKEKEVLEEIAKERKENRERELDLPSSDSDDEYLQAYRGGGLK